MSARHPRLDQLLASLGYGSRREAGFLLRAGRVTAAGQPVKDGALRLDPAAVRVDGEPLDHPGGILVLLHKPAGHVCSHETREGPRVYDLLPPRWLARNPAPTTVGRLDRDTTGVLLVTDRMDLVQRWTSPRRKLPKVYVARVDREPRADAAAVFASGTLVLEAETDPCAPADLRPRGPLEWEVTLTEGRYHQVKRMFAAVGSGVVTLHRERFGALELGGLASGAWRAVTEAEVDGGAAAVGA